MMAVADPGFPVGEGGVDLTGVIDSRGSYVSKILYVEMNEMKRIWILRGGGVRRVHPLDPPMG